VLDVIFCEKKSVLFRSVAAFRILKFDLILLANSASTFHACSDLNVCCLFVSNCPSRTQSEFELELTAMSPGARALG
jgi:hypothetical protein